MFSNFLEDTVNSNTTYGMNKTQQTLLLCLEGNEEMLFQIQKDECEVKSVK